jgi:hypothetical protein
VKLPAVVPSAKPTQVRLTKYDLGAEPTASIFISSIPPIVTVVMDDKCVAVTNLMEIRLLPGPATLTFMKGPADTTITFGLVPGGNGNHMVQLPRTELPVPPPR